MKKDGKCMGIKRDRLKVEILAIWKGRDFASRMTYFDVFIQKE